MSEKVPRKICPVCGKRFYAPPSQERRLKPGSALTCSTKCAGALRAGKNSYNWKGGKVQKVCSFCKQNYFVYPNDEERSKYCSRKCAIEACRKEKPLPAKSNPNWRPYNWKGGKVERECENCGAKFMAIPASVAKGQARYCSRRCWGKVMVKIMQGRQYNSTHGGKRSDLNGQYFRSSWEANYARYLNWLISIGEIKSWQYEPDTFEFTTIKKGTRFYTPDFKITNKDNSIEYHEIKGYMDDRSATKLKRMSKYYPAIKVILIDKDQYAGLSKQLRGIISGWEIAGKHAW